MTVHPNATIAMPSRWLMVSLFSFRKKIVTIPPNPKVAPIALSMGIRPSVHGVNIKCQRHHHGTAKKEN